MVCIENPEGAELATLRADIEWYETVGRMGELDSLSTVGGQAWRVGWAYRGHIRPLQLYGTVYKLQFVRMTEFRTRSLSEDFLHRIKKFRHRSTHAKQTVPD